MGTAIVGLLLLAAISGIVHHLYKQKKAGNSLSCGCNCKQCAHGCGEVSTAKEQEH